MSVRVRACDEQVEYPNMHPRIIAQRILVPICWSMLHAAERHQTYGADKE